MLIAFSVLLYPTVSNYLYQKNQSRVISSYDEEAVKTQWRENERMLAAARAYNQETLSNIDFWILWARKKGSSMKIIRVF